MKLDSRLALPVYPIVQTSYKNKKKTAPIQSNPWISKTMMFPIIAVIASGLSIKKNMIRKKAKYQRVNLSMVFVLRRSEHLLGAFPVREIIDLNYSHMSSLKII